MENAELNIQFSNQSQAILKLFPSIDSEDIVRWYLKNKLIIGGSHIIEYLEYKANEVK